MFQFPDVDCAQLLARSGNSSFSVEEVVRDVAWKALNLSSGNQGKRQCYCSSLLSKAGIAATSAATFRDPATGADEKWCYDWILQVAQKNALTVGSTLIVLVVNSK